MSTQEQRERFEKALRHKLERLIKNPHCMAFRDGDYCYLETSVAWMAWKDAEAAAIERIAAWIEPQRNDVPATGKEFASAIRVLLSKEES